MASEPPLPHNRLVVATTNRGKLAELRALLLGLPVHVQAIRDVLADPPHVVEDGATFADNAVKKARASAAATGMLSLADDSGLEVDALGGRPGVWSARFAYDGASDAENSDALLAALGAMDVAPSNRAPWGSGDAMRESGFPARFRCVLALVDPSREQEPWIVEGVCEGVIVRTPRGSGGFGYDPLFMPADCDETLAELGPEAKNRISHRARAFAALRPLLQRVLGSPG